MIKVAQQLWRKLGLLFMACILFSSCGVIIGGSNYIAHVSVEDHPEAVISFEGKSKGYGTAKFLARRRKADSFSIKVKEPGCKEQVFDFTEKTYRGWSIAGSLVTGIGLIGGIPVPFGLLVDGAAGSLWEPDVDEKGVSELNYKNFHYNLNYTGCMDKNTITTKEIKPKAEQLTDLKKLLDQGILTQKEFENAKKRILAK